jgi:predicted AAA+ superfamily ATPase
MQKRGIMPIINRLLTYVPVVLIEGPRSVGKSTILHEVASKIGATTVDLDDPPTRAAIGADPTLVLSSGGPVCIDEYQKVPKVLEVIKAELNKGASPGRFILTGSARHDALPIASEALTGRLDVVTVYPLSQGEIGGVAENFVQTALADPAALVTKDSSTTSRDEYIRRVCSGGFPLALQAHSLQAQRRWVDNYVRLSLQRDLLEISKLRQGEKMQDLLKATVGQTGQMLKVASLATSSSLTEFTADAYITLLEKLFLIHRLEAWGTTLHARSTKHPKVHVLDSGVGARLMRLTPENINAQNASALTEYGHLLESFTVCEILKQGSWCENLSGKGHFRTSDGDEVDLVLENNEGSVVGFEVTAAKQVSDKEFRGLRFLKEKLGDRFLGGIYLYAGSRSYTIEQQLHVMPLDRLWTP